MNPAPNQNAANAEQARRLARKRPRDRTPEVNTCEVEVHPLRDGLINNSATLSEDPFSKFLAVYRLIHRSANLQESCYYAQQQWQAMSLSQREAFLRQHFSG